MAVNNHTERSARDLEFFGKITASISHELNNVVSIIDQVGGLLEDYVAMMKSGYTPNVDQLEKVSQKIQMQTGRGVDIIRNLNKFAHSVDDPLKEFDLNDVLSNLCTICQRLAGLKRVTLKEDFAETELMVTNNPFLVQEIIFLALQWAFDQAGDDGEVRLSTSMDRDIPVVEIVTKTTEEQSRSFLDGEVLAEILQATEIESETFQDNTEKRGVRFKFQSIRANDSPTCQKCDTRAIL